MYTDDTYTKKIKRKKKEKTWMQKILDRFLKRKKRPEEITRPAGVRTPEQIKEWKEIMRETGGRKKKKTQVLGTRG